MSEDIGWLPKELDISCGTFREIIQILYAIFEKDIKYGQLKYQGCKVGFSRKVKPDGLGYEEIFWHLVTREDKITAERYLDYRRAEKLPWIKAMIKHQNDACLKVWDYQEGSIKKGVRTYIWLENWDFVVILQKIQRTKVAIYNIITSFHLDGDGSRRRMHRKWVDRIK